MLRLYVTRSDLAREWHPSAGGWVGGESFIRPYRHPALEDFSIATEGKLLVVVRERWQGGSQSVRPALEGGGLLDSAEFEARLAEIKEWPLQFIAVLVSRGERDRGVTIFNGGWATAPIYLLEGRETLRGDWDPVELYPHVHTRTLDPELASHFLVSFARPYSRRTLIPDIQLLTERSCARWGMSNGEKSPLRIDYPLALSSPHPRTLKPGADVLAMFELILRSSMERWISPAVTPACELSSGLDSGVVSSVAASINSEPVHTLGIIVAGEMAEGQRARRKMFIDRFGFRDLTVEACRHLPLSPESERLRENRVVPWEECYYEATEQLFKLMPRTPGVVIFTGVGGDELFYKHWQELSSREREECLNEDSRDRADLPGFLTGAAVEAYYDTLDGLDLAPPSLVSTSALEAVSNMSAQYLRSGFWPVSPLCTPELVWFCRSLPLEWRENRELQRRFLLRLECPREVAYPEKTENFTPVMEAAMSNAARPLINEIFLDSRLADMGLIKPDILLASYADYCDGAALKGGALQFYEAAILELTLRCLESRSRGLTRDEKDRN
jgi:asparagine synthase (glutamine-hydrolysing)